jgi:hypothetical protein
MPATHARNTQLLLFARTTARQLNDRAFDALYTHEAAVARDNLTYGAVVRELKPLIDLAAAARDN